MSNVYHLKKEYAYLVLKSGLNLQKGQRLVISCPVECADFARICTSLAYQLGCKEVIMRWTDDDIIRDKFLYASSDVFDAIEPWDVQFYNCLTEEKACWLRIHAENPGNLNGVEPDRIRRSQISNGIVMQKFRNSQMKNKHKWCICAVPIQKWANAVFKDLDEDSAMMKLWEHVLVACRVDGNNAVNNWGLHLDDLRKHVDVLNSYSLKKLHFKNSLGTDVVVELIDESFWSGGREQTPDGELFCANIPSEEVFISPKRNGVNGRIIATKPLVFKGTLIEGFSFVVKDGKIIEVNAKTGENVLRDAIAVDEGASYFGEVALVPFDSPISKLDVLFYNTLFDENASCHFAFGRGFPCLKGAEMMTEKELAEKGINYSITHVDFMIGSPDLCINGITKNGENIAIFRNGNFVF